MMEEIENQGKATALRNVGQPSKGIKSWATGDQPREKMIRQGVNQLSDSELLAILIGTGWGTRSAIDLAREIWDLANRNWLDFGKMGISKLMKIKGIGEAKAIVISAAIEIGKRRQATSTLHRPVIRSSQDAAAILQPVLADHPNEAFCILFLNQANRVIHMEMISQGGITGTVVDPRIVFKKALDHGVASLVLCHNHPSGNLRPSDADLGLTRKLRDAGKLLDILIVDHLIVSQEGYFSFSDEGML